MGILLRAVSYLEEKEGKENSMQYYIRSKYYSDAAAAAATITAVFVNRLHRL